MGAAGTVPAAIILCLAIPRTADTADRRGDPVSFARPLPWRILPPCFPPVSTVRRWFYLWRDNGLSQTLNPYLLMASREIHGREAAPGAVVNDSQSVKAIERRPQRL